MYIYFRSIEGSVTRIELPGLSSLPGKLVQSLLQVLRGRQTTKQIIPIK